MTFLNLTLASALAIIVSFIFYILLSISALRKLERGRLVIILMRVFAFILLSIAILRIAVRREKNVLTKGKVAVLVDTSGSMFLPSKEEGAISEFIRRKEEILEKLRDRGFNIETFSVDETISPLTEEALSDRNRETRIVDSLRRFIDRRKNDLNGIILISDGYDHSVAKAEALKPLKFPVNTVIVPFHKRKDIWVDEVKVPYLIFRKVPVKVEARIKGVDADGEHRFTIYLDGEPVERGTFNLERGEGKIEREITIPSEGDFLIAVKVEELRGELTYLNNVKVKKVKVVRDRIRTLQLVGTPTWDVRFLRRFLKKNRSVELISFMILRTQEDALYFSESELSLIPFPSREIFEEALDTFDVAFFQNFNYAPYLGWNGDYYLERVRREIEKGLGFVIIGGDRALSRGGYMGTPLELSLPVKVRNVENPLLKGEFYVELTDEGKLHPVTSFLVPYQDKLPPLTGINVDIKVKDDAIVLMREKGKGIPIIVVGNYGKGRVCVIATDSLWRWYFTARGKDGIDLYTPLMERILYWAGQDYTFSEVSLREEGNRAVIEVKDNMLKACVHCKVKVTAKTPDGRFISAKEIETNDSGELTLDENFAVPPYVVNIEVHGKIGSFHFGVLGESRREYSELYSSSSSLKEIAQITGGAFFKIDNFDPDKIVLKGGIKGKEESFSELWDTPLFIFVFSIIILFEWTIRRKWGLE